MQGTIFGASCAARARLRAECTDTGGSLKTSWDDDDFADPGLDVLNKGRSAERKKRIFRAWLEAWETEVIKKQDPVNEAKLLQKYGGLMWLDPDTDKKFMASREVMHWNPMRDCRGYCVKGLQDAFDPDDPKDDRWEPWILDPNLLHTLIVQYYVSHPDKNLTVVSSEENDLAKSRRKTEVEKYEKVIAKQKGKNKGNGKGQTVRLKKELLGTQESSDEED